MDNDVFLAANHVEQPSTVKEFEFNFLNDGWRSLLNLYTMVFIISLFTFFYASRLVRNPVTFYVASAVLGVCSSLIIVAYALQKLLPRSALAFPLYLGGWPLSFYIYYKAWQNFGLMVHNYQMYMIIYVGIVMLLSLAFCYRFGPPNDPRTLNLIKWTAQLLSLAGIYFSYSGFSNNQPVAIALTLCMATWPLWKFVCRIISEIYSCFSERLRKLEFLQRPRQLLTEAEYQDEAKFYTQIELKKLRDSVRESPSLESWRIISRLSNPQRMASFVNGELDHVTKEERTAFFDDVDSSFSEDDDDESVTSQSNDVTKQSASRVIRRIALPSWSKSIVTMNDNSMGLSPSNETSVRTRTSTPSLTSRRRMSWVIRKDVGNGDFITDDDDVY